MRITCAKMLVVAVAACALPARAQVTVSVDPAVQYQTILGWGASSWSPPWVTQALRQEIIAEAVDELGLTRLRLEPPSGNRSTGRNWEWLNDNGDPYDINWTAFNTGVVDKRVSEMVMPFKQHVEANGEPFNIYVSPSFFNSGSSGGVPAWLRYSPGEYSEYASAILLYLRNTYGIEADYYCILNEAGNNNPFTASLVADMIKVLGPRLQALGFSTEIEFPECISAQVSWNYIQNVQNDDDMWQWVGVVTYHLYGTNDPYRSLIRDFAISRGLPTGQTEYMGLNMDHLYDDFTLGGVSYWEVYGIGSQFEWNYNRLARKGQYWNFRQVMHYVRPGAIRIGAASDDPALRTLAFEHNSEITVVLINSSGSRLVNIASLPAGTYGVCHNLGSGPYQELGLQTVGPAHTLSVNVASNAVMTVYPYSGPNGAPTPTDWKASSDYLTMPSDSTMLSASATDAESDSISYAWSVTSQPPGANPVLATPNAPNTSARGLTVAGDYIFTIAVSDSAGVVTREVRLTVFSDNQPALPDDVHNRIPVIVTLPTDSTLLRAWAWDLEGDVLTYQWSVVSQPPGANVSLINPNSTNCTASNMAVAGDYIFEFEVSDPMNTVSDTLIVPVYPINTAPVIDTAYASPETLMLPTDSTSLSAITHDPDGDTTTHWWSVASCPAGAAPVFVTPGHPNTMVTDLDSVGTYVLTLTVVDGTKFTSEDVAVIVTPGVGVEEGERPLLPRRLALAQNYPNPFSRSTTIRYQLTRRHGDRETRGDLSTYPFESRGSLRATRLSSSKSEGQRISLSVYDLAGRLVRTLVDGEQEPGYYRVAWDGKDGKGTRVSCGLYFCQLSVGSEMRKLRKMLVLR